MPKTSDEGEFNPSPLWEVSPLSSLGIVIRLEVYVPFRGQRLWRGEERIPTGTTAGALISLLGLTEPELAVLVNGRNLPAETILHTGDEVAVLRQAEGGGC